ncbi:MAG: GNAT family N-acetyltransferase [Micromonosporaceae bacterium]|nr:GNAT family N-acetyltransferase [Micromonosporaceae bacterium]
MTTAGRLAEIQAFPRLSVSTPRLVVRPLVAEDAAGVTAVFGDRVTQRWLPMPRDYTVEDARDWCTTMAQRRRARGEGDHYGIIRRADDQLVGCAWVRRADWGVRSAELTFAVGPSTRGYGVAPEAVDVIAIALLLEHDMQRIELRVVPGNLSARRVAEKAGFTYEGLMRNAGQVHSGRVDLELWSMVAADVR